MEDRQSLPLDGIDTTRETGSYLVMETRGELYAVRWPLVKQAGMLLQTEIDCSVEPPHVWRNGHCFAVLCLWELVGLEPPTEKLMEIPAVFLEQEDRRIVVASERVLWKQEGVFKELPQWLRKVPVVTGTIRLGSGVVVVVLEPFRHGLACEQMDSGPTP